MPSRITATPKHGGGSGRRLQSRKAILSISAHWYVPGTGVTVTTAPRTIHDFGGFPPELYQVQYPAPGDPALARMFSSYWRRWTWSSIIPGVSITAHGPCCGMFIPAADIPVVQLSIDETKPASFHFEIGKKLALLREEGVLIVGSGNLVHNLHTYAWGRHPRDPYDWAVRFECAAKDIMLSDEYKPLVNYEMLGSGRRTVDPDTGSLFAASLRPRRPAEQ